MGIVFGIGLEIKPKQVFALKDIRKKKGIKRNELAKLSQVPVATIKSLENGENDVFNAKMSTLVKLAVALKCKVRDFYPNEKHI